MTDKKACKTDAILAGLGLFGGFTVLYLLVAILTWYRMRLFP